MVEIDLTPTYRGLWLRKEEDILGREYSRYALFSMWLKGKGVGKILEEYRKELAEADTKITLDNGIQIEFVKKYRNPIGDLLKDDITYFGRGSAMWKQGE